MVHLTSLLQQGGTLPSISIETLSHGRFVILKQNPSVEGTY